MSWLVLNEILGLAVVDLCFQKELLAHPLDAVVKKRFPLTLSEKTALSEVEAENLQEFTQQLIELLNNEPHS